MFGSACSSFLDSSQFVFSSLQQISSLIETLICSFYFYFSPPISYIGVFQHFTRAFSHQLTARCRAPQVILSWISVEARSVSQLDDLLCTPLCTTSKQFHDEVFPIENSTSCLISVCNIKQIRRYGSRLKAIQSVVEALLNRNFYVYLIFIVI